MDIKICCNSVPERVAKLTYVCPKCKTDVTLEYILAMGQEIDLNPL